MKKLLALVSALALTITLAACGDKPAESSSSSSTSSASSSSVAATEPATTPTEAPTSATEPAESALSTYEQQKQAILEYVDVAYTGLTPAGAPMYFMAGGEGEYVALVLENANGQSYVKFVGSGVIDEASGILTVTDSDTGYSFGFTAEQQADGSFFLDCGNLGEAYLKPDEPGTVVDSMVVAFETMENVTDSFMDAAARLNLMDTLDVAYTGLTAAEAPMFFLASSDGTFAALVLVGASGESYISFVGSAAVDEETGIITVTDSESGNWFGFSVEPQDDGSFFLDCGNLGQCYLEPDTIENVVDYIDTVYLEMEDVTDAVIAELAN